MPNNSKNFEVNIHQGNAESSAQRLIQHLIDHYGIDIDNKTNLFEVFESLSPNDYLALRDNIFLKDLISEIIISDRKSCVAPSFDEFDIGNARLSLQGADPKHIKALRRYEKHTGLPGLPERLNEILSLNYEELIAIPSFGATSVGSLIELRDAIRGEIRLIEENKVNYENFESTLISPKTLESVSLERIGGILLEDIDSYFDKIVDKNGMDIDIAQRRWGFIDKRECLEDIAKIYSLTRERIRQKVEIINEGLLRHLRCSQAALWKIIEPKLSPDIEIKFEQLFSCFSSEVDFYDFLGLLCGQENLFDRVYPEVDKSILNAYFAENGAPVHINEVKCFLEELKFGDKVNLDNAVHNLVRQDAILIEGEYVWPRQLRKAEAIACILVDYEKGLPWQDIAKLANSNGYSKSEIYEDRLDYASVQLPDYIFLSGKGIYKHTNFIDGDAISMEDIFSEIRSYAEAHPDSSFHLNDCYRSKEKLKQHDYFVIRHYVKNFGEDHGVYFTGRSQADSVSLDRDAKNVTQKDVILREMNRRGHPLTKPEIANLLKSKSLGHAAFYLDDLIGSGKVVQVDRMLYTTPSVAYKNIDIEKYVGAIDEILRRHAKPVEPSIFKEELNSQLSQSFSKYFYSSIAQLYAVNRGWFRRHNLYSITEIPFRSLNAALGGLCNPHATANENIAKLQTQIAITRETAAIALANWRNASAK